MTSRFQKHYLRHEYYLNKVVFEGICDRHLGKEQRIGMDFNSLELRA
ncbi:MAG: hypothetical protein WBM86_29615 [Waterburya sp.]